MPLLAQLTVTALLLPLAISPPGALVWSQMQAVPPEAAMPPAPVAAPVAAPATPPPAVAPAPVASPTVVAPAGSTVVVSDGAPTTVVSAWPTEAVSTTTATTTTTTATTTTTTMVPTPSPAASTVMAPKDAVRTLLRYDPYLAPRYRSGRNMMIGGGVTLGIGMFTMLSTLSWLTLSREAADDSTDAAERRHDIRERDKWVPTARIVGLVAAGVALTGVALLVAGGVRRRRAIEEARGRVYMQAGPGGMQVRF